ncbi:hypothetical protein GH877_29475 [Bacillus thuringiensis]|nr:hypothetical protein [Bacillus thuringiensis]
MKPVPSVRPSYCYLPAVLGLCKDYMSSWFYNARTGLCTKFIYGGCGGNKNRFSSELRCKVTCRARGRPCRSLVCTHYCNYGFKRNKYGCRICSCRSPPPGITTA